MISCVSSITAYRFQLAGYRDALEYSQALGIKLDEVRNCKNARNERLANICGCFLLLQVDRWPENNRVRKLARKNGTFYYYNRKRECPDKNIRQIKIYVY